MIGFRVYKLISSWYGKVVLQTCFVKFCVINAHPYLLLAFLTNITLTSHNRYCASLTKLVVTSLSSLSSVAFSCQSRCYTFLLHRNIDWVNSKFIRDDLINNSFISLGVHAKIFMLLLRNVSVRSR